MLKNIYCLIFLLALTGCEPRFVGDRPFDVQSINAPFPVKIVTLGSGASRYLAVINTNADATFQTGSLQFYDLAAASDPQKDETLSISVPSNVSDFYVEAASNGTQRLFVADRNEDKLFVYSRTSGAFSPVLDGDGNALFFDVFRNPQSLVYFEFSGKRLLAINSMNALTVQFFDLDAMSILNQDDLVGLFPDIQSSGYRFTRDGKIGALLSMRVRQPGSSTDDVANALRGISRSETEGAGMGKLMMMPSTVGTEFLLIGASYTNTALFGFQFSNFDNNSNVLLNLNQAQRGYRDDNGTRFPGTNEQGFRGLAIDGNDDVWVSSRSDNGIYKFSKNLFLASRQSIFGQNPGGNTLALAEDKTRLSLSSADTTTITIDKVEMQKSLSEVLVLPEETLVSRLDFEIEDEAGTGPRTDDDFPRLGELQVNAAGSRVWVLGLEQKDGRGYDASRLYMIDSSDVASPNLLDTETFSEGDSPQNILYSEADGIIYTSFVGSNKVGVFDVSGSSIDLVRFLE